MKAIKSVLANRKLFQGGGLVPPGNLNPANGILASSESLIDAVVRDAVGPQGGPTMSMNQGGIARFHAGGSIHSHPHAGEQSYRPGIGIGRKVETSTYPRGYPDVTPEQWMDMVRADPSLKDTPKASRYEYVDAATPEEWEQMKYPSTTTRQPGTATIAGLPWSPSEGSTTSPAEARYNMMFPYSAEVDKGLFTMNPGLAENLVSQESWLGEGAPSYAEMGASLPLNVANFLSQVGVRLTYHGGKTLRNSIGFLFEKQDDEALGWGKTRAFTNMIAAQPDYAVELGQISDALMATEEGQNMSPDEYRLNISETFFNQKKVEAEDFEIGQGKGVQEWFDEDADRTPSEDLIAAKDRATEQETREFLAQGLVNDLRTYQGMMDDPGQQIAFIKELTASKGDKYVADLLARVTDVGEQQTAMGPAPATDELMVTDTRIERPASFGVDPEADIATGGELEVSPPPEKPDAPLTDADPGAEALSALLAAQPEVETKEVGSAFNDGTPKGAGNESVANRWAADIAAAANTDDQEDLDAKLQSYVDRFKNLIPEYKGKSEWEKGMDIVKMGMAIAAGESPNAVKNIAQGVLATIDNFTEDEEERRKYEQQIGISAANYALAAAQRDDVAAAELAKELRTDQQFVVGTTFEHKGVTYPAGSLFIASTGDVRSEEFGADILPNLTTEGLYETYLDNKVDVIDLTKPRMIAAGKGTPTVKQLDDALLAYNETINDARTSAKMMTMLDSSIILNAQGRATGFSAWASRKVNSLRNSIGMKKELTILEGIGSKEGRESKQFRYQQQVIANMMLKEILGEGSKNVSNIDRDLAQQIVGLMTDWGSIFDSPELLGRRLQHIRSTVQQNLVTRFDSLSDKEFAWQNWVNAAGQSIPGKFEEKRQTRLSGDITRLSGLVEQAPTDLEEGEVYIPPKVLSISEYWDFDTGKLKKPISGTN